MVELSILKFIAGVDAMIVLGLVLYYILNHLIGQTEKNNLLDNYGTNQKSQKNVLSKIIKGILIILLIAIVDILIFKNM